MTITRHEAAKMLAAEFGWCDLIEIWGWGNKVIVGVSGTRGDLNREVLYGISFIEETDNLVVQGCRVKEFRVGDWVRVLWLKVVAWYLVQSLPDYIQKGGLVRVDADGKVTRWSYGFHARERTSVGDFELAVERNAVNDKFYFVVDGEKLKLPPVLLDLLPPPAQVVKTLLDCFVLFSI